MKKTLKISLFVIIGIVVLGVIGSLTSKDGKDSFQQGMNQAKEVVNEPAQQPTQTNQPTQIASPSPTTQKPIYTIEAKAEKKNDSNITVSGTSNLPNYALLTLEARRQVLMSDDTELREALSSQTTSKASVFEGKFVTDILLPDTNTKKQIALAPELYKSVSDELIIVISFNPLREQPAQNKEVLQILGAKGENLLTSPQLSTVGAKTDNPYHTLETRIKIQIPYK